MKETNMDCIWKKYLLKMANNLLKAHSEDVEAARQNVNVWLKRTETIISFLNLLSSQLEDGNVTEGELKATIEKFNVVVKSW